MATEPNSAHGLGVIQDTNLFAWKFSYIEWDSHLLCIEIEIFKWFLKFQ